MAHTFNASTWEVEIGTCLWVWGQPGLFSDFQDNHDYVERPCLKKERKKERERNE